MPYKNLLNVLAIDELFPHNICKHKMPNLTKLYLFHNLNYYYFQVTEVFKISDNYMPYKNLLNVLAIDNYSLIIYVA
ncbi:putative bifunctional signaling protein/50S ribosomal protein L9 [Ehrlichia ruminantium]|nr:putative bifunctional signaling protein/50S ribosomal protein L9 [Ehrlichia ruminantium]